MSQGWACDLQTEHAVTWKSWVGRCGDVKVNDVHLETISRQYPYCENETIFIWGHLPSVGAEHTQWSAVTCRPPHLFPSLKLSLQTACDFPQGSNLLPSMRPPVAVFQQPYHPMTRWPQHVIQKNKVCKKKDTIEHVCIEWQEKASFTSVMELQIQISGRAGWKARQ